MIHIETNYRGMLLVITSDPYMTIHEQIQQAASAIDAMLARDAEPEEKCEGPKPDPDLHWDEGDNSPQLPVWKCHKIVEGAKIVGFRVRDEGVAELTLAVGSGRLTTLMTLEGWTERFRGSDTDLGYYVIYEDGFTSWSPTAAFENGYERID